MRRFFLLVFILMVGLIPAIASAATPTTINYQGRLTSNLGNPVRDSSYLVVFTIYDDPTGGSTIWTESQSVTTSAGSFVVLLGAVTSLTDAVFSTDTRYLGIKVGTDPEMTPRVALVSVPYAFRVGTVDGSTGGSVSGNLILENSSTTGGNILKGSALFLHNFGDGNNFVGQYAGNLTMTGTANTGIGSFALWRNSTGGGNTAGGYQALYNNTTGGANTATGQSALYSNTEGSNNTAGGFAALGANTIGNGNTAEGSDALNANTTGQYNTACGAMALYNNVSGSFNTTIGYAADVSANNLSNATAIGSGAVVNASNKIRLGNSSVTVIEGQVAYTFTSDAKQKENFLPVDGEEILRKISSLSLASWNYQNQDASLFRHYGPTAQEFFAAFGHDGIGLCGDSITINSGDEAGITLIAVKELIRQNQELKAEIAELRKLVQAQAEAERK